MATTMGHYLTQIESIKCNKSSQTSEEPKLSMNDHQMV